MQMKMGNAACSELRLVFSGFYLLNGSGAETNIGNDQSVEAAIEWPGASTVTVRATFGGQNIGTIVDGIAEYVSDPILPSSFGLTSFPAGTTFYYRSRRIVGLGLKHAKHGASGATGENTFYCDGSAASQLMGTGVMAKQTGGATALAELGPTAIIGRPKGIPDFSVLLVGDSIMDGNNDNSIDGDGSAGGGWSARGLWSVSGRTVPFIKCSVGGSLAQHFADGFTKRSVYFKYCTHAVCNYGTNDLVAGRSATQVLADLQVIWASLKTSRIRHVEQTLIFPRVTSSNSYVDAAGQTTLSGFDLGGTKRDPLNASIIAAVGANGLDNYLDLNGAVADPAALDKWVSNGTTTFATSDGTHPQPAIEPTIAAIFTTRVATWV
jgi:hypothetical protein